MIVYGDPAYEATLDALLARLKARLRGASRAACPSLDELRTLLIEAGQLEQAAHDGLPALLPPEEARRHVEALQTATDHAARAFCACWDGTLLCATAAGAPVSHALDRMADALERVRTVPGARLTVKLPEGFAFYALYPEQYCAAAARWLTEHAADTPRHAVVIGIRSIGTSLSAVVAATLSAAGWQTARLTVRPSGHPFSRAVTMRREALKRADWALVVDEGPGLSGSSMAAAAQALADAGMDPACICFFPGHCGEPGAAASAATRAWWARAPRCVVPRNDLRWDGRTLPETLAALTPALCGIDSACEQVEDLGGGLWRRALYENPGRWPAVSAPFERPKYRCTTRGGGAVLWKYAGLAVGPDGPGAAAEATRLAALAAGGWTPAPLATASGFVATPWVNGVPLTHADLDAGVLAHIGRYLAHAARSPLSPSEQEAALGRLREMLYWNTWEALGEEAAARARRWADAAAGWEHAASTPAYGDGRLAPQEWLRTPNGSLIKVDSTGHDADHTVVGRQPLAWDVAGALVEWGLTAAEAEPLLAAMREAGGPAIPPSSLTFYSMAYAAFRVGQTTLCSGMSAHDPEEQARLSRATAFYREPLARLLVAEAVSLRG